MEHCCYIQSPLNYGALLLYTITIKLCSTVAIYNGQLLLTTARYPTSSLYSCFDFIGWSAAKIKEAEFYQKDAVYKYMLVFNNFIICMF